MNKSASISRVITLVLSLSLACSTKPTSDAIPQASLPEVAVVALSVGVDAGPAVDAAGGMAELRTHDAIDSGIGRRPKRHLPDAEAPAPEASVSAAPPPSAARPRGSSMTNEQPYGASQSSATPLLGKKPLSPDDPWGNKPKP